MKFAKVSSFIEESSRNSFLPQSRLLFIFLVGNLIADVPAGLKSDCVFWPSLSIDFLQGDLSLINFIVNKNLCVWYLNNDEMFLKIYFYCNDCYCCLILSIKIQITLTKFLIYILYFLFLSWMKSMRITKMITESISENYREKCERAQHYWNPLKSLWVMFCKSWILALFFFCSFFSWNPPSHFCIFWGSFKTLFSSWSKKGHFVKIPLLTQINFVSVNFFRDISKEARTLLKSIFCKRKTIFCILSGNRDFNRISHKNVFYFWWKSTR